MNKPVSRSLALFMTLLLLPLPSLATCGGGGGGGMGGMRAPGMGGGEEVYMSVSIELFTSGCFVFYRFISTSLNSSKSLINLPEGTK